MTYDEMLDYAIDCGFERAAIIETSEIVFDPSFRKFCEQNTCGNYNANYSCPPVCGTPEEMKAKVLAHSKALVYQSTFRDMSGSEMGMRIAKMKHGKMAVDLVRRMVAEDHVGFQIGANACDVCPSCVKEEGGSCKYPDRRFSCLSAYCIDCAKLAATCGMPFYFCDDEVSFYGLYVFD